MQVDIRQSDPWAEYLKFWEWESIETTKNTKVYILHKLNTHFAKIQRPKYITKDELEEIEKICADIGCFQIKIEPRIEKDANLLEEEGYIKSNAPLAPSKTVIVNLLKNEDSLWKDVSRGGKSSINNAKKDAIKIGFHIYPQKTVVDNFYSNYFETCRHNKVQPFPLEAIYQEVGVFKEHSFIALAKDTEDNILSAALFLGVEDTVWYMHGGTSKRGRKTKAGNLLFWEALLYFKKLGFTAIDLEGIYDKRFSRHTKKWKGFTQFKKSFGGSEITFPPTYYKLTNRFLHKIAKNLKIKL